MTWFIAILCGVVLIVLSVIYTRQERIKKEVAHLHWLENKKTEFMRWSEQARRDGLGGQPQRTLQAWLVAHIGKEVLLNARPWLVTEPIFAGDYASSAMNTPVYRRKMVWNTPAGDITMPPGGYTDVTAIEGGICYREGYGTVNASSYARDEYQGWVQKPEEVEDWRVYEFTERS